MVVGKHQSIQFPTKRRRAQKDNPGFPELISFQQELIPDKYRDFPQLPLISVHGDLHELFHSIEISLCITTTFRNLIFIT